MARCVRALGFEISCTGGTWKYLASKVLQTDQVLKVGEGRPNIVDKIVDAGIQLVINITFGKQEIADSFSIRRKALMHGMPYCTTVQAARMAVGAIEALSQGDLPVRSLQQHLGRAD